VNELVVVMHGSVLLLLDFVHIRGNNSPLVLFGDNAFSVYGRLVDLNFY
jgi:hypothetical protein